MNRAQRLRTSLERSDATDTRSLMSIERVPTRTGLLTAPELQNLGGDAAQFGFLGLVDNVGDDLCGRAGG